MDVWEARAVLEVADADDWEAIRAAYRRLIRLTHPDTAGPHPATTRAAARLNAAYAVLSRAKRAGVLDAPRPVPRGAEARHSATTTAPRPAPAGTGGWPPPPAPPPRAGVAAVGTDTLMLAAPPDEAFTRLLDAGHRVGSVTYVDRSCAIFELVVQLDGEACSLVVTLQGRAHGTEAFLTLESLERVASHSPERVLRRLADALA